jgi:GT2 family glycosyltransferase/Flp pilus assembly protein TadD
LEVKDDFHRIKDTVKGLESCGGAFRLHVTVSRCALEDYLWLIDKKKQGLITTLSLSQEGRRHFPTVSLAMFTYNRIKYTREALKTLMGNTRYPFDLVIIDNHSTDGTRQWLEEIRWRYADRIKEVIFNPKNEGLPGPTNAFWQSSTADLLGKVDNDTLVPPGWLERLVDAHRKMPDLAVVGGYHFRAEDFDETAAQAKIVQANGVRILFDTHIGGCCYLMKKSVQEKFGLMDVHPTLKTHGWTQYQWRLVQAGYTVGYLYPLLQLDYMDDPRSPKCLIDSDYKDYARRIWKERGVKLDSSDQLVDWIRSDAARVTRQAATVPTKLKVSKAGSQKSIAANRTAGAEPVVSLVILTHNQLKYTRICLERILRHTDIPIELIVVDNASADGTPAYLETLKKSVPALRTIYNDDNVGFAAGNNQGIMIARGRYVLLMNNDLAVTPGWLGRLISCAEKHHRVGMVGPRSNCVSGPQWVEKVDYETQSLEGLNRFSAEFAQQHAGKDRRLLRVVGFCMLIKRQVIDKIGGLDHRYGLGNFEDDDFSLRAALAGFESRVADDCFVHHFGSRTFVGEKIDYRKSLLRNWSLFKEKWGLPQELPYETGYNLNQISAKSFDPGSHYIALHADDNIGSEVPEPASSPSSEKYRAIQALLAEGRPEVALQELRALVKSAPDFAAAHNDLGVLYYQAGDKEKSSAHYRIAVRLEPNNPIYLKNLADLVCVEFGQIEEALQLYVSVLEIEPSDIETLRNTGHICRLLNRHEDAEYFYRRAHDIDPRHVETDDCPDRSLISSDSPAAGPPTPNSRVKIPADPALKAVLEKKSPEGGLQNGPFVSILVPLDVPQNKLKKCLDALTENTALSYELLLLDTGARKRVCRWAHQQAEKHYGWKVIPSQSRSTLAGMIDRGIEAASGDILVWLSGDVVVFNHWLADMLACMSGMPNPGVVGPMTNSAGGIQQVVPAPATGGEEAAEFAENFRQRNRFRRVLCDRLDGFCMLFSRRLAEEVGPLDAFLSKDGSLSHDFCLRAALAGFINMVAGSVYVQRPNRKITQVNTTRCDRKWSAVDRQSETGKRYLAHITTANAKVAFEKGNTRQGVALFLDAIRHSPRAAGVYHQFAECLIHCGRHQQAKEVLEEVPGIAPDLRTLELKAYAAEGLENDSEALRLADEVLRLNGASAAALNLKGVLAYRNGDMANAEKFYRRAIDAEPSFGEPYTNLAVLQWRSEPDAALALFERAFILSPDVTDIAANYHAAVSQSGMYARAEVVFHEARHLYPHNKNICFKYIDTLLKQGKFALAMAEVEAAMVVFGAEEGTLEAALSIRKKLGPVTIDGNGGKKSTVSLCMIVKNEEAHLARCLQSVKPVVDEMVLVDTGSGDRTKDVASAFGAKVYDFSWSDDFAAARNYALEKASGAWTLHLDADEVLSPLDYEAFRKLLQRSKSISTGYIFNTRNYTWDVNQMGWQANDGKYAEEAGAGWTPSEKVRLFPRDHRIRFEFPVHELVEPSLKRCGMAMQRCAIPVHHYGKLDRQQCSDKEEAYYLIGKKKLAETGDDPVALRELAIQAEVLGKHAEAIDLWERFIVLQPANAAAYVNMGIVHSHTGNFEAVRDTAEKALALAPQLKEAHYNYALAQLRLGCTEDAVRVLEKLLKRNMDYPPAEFLLAAAYCCEGKKTSGRQLLERLRQSVIGPSLDGRCVELARGFVESGRSDFACSLLEATMDCGCAGLKLTEFYASLQKETMAEAKTGTYE